MRRREILVEGVGAAHTPEQPRAQGRYTMTKKTAVPEIQITCDLAGWADAIRAADDPAALVGALVWQTAARGVQAGSDLVWQDIKPKIVHLLMKADRDGYARGRKAGARTLDADSAAALGTSLAAALAKLPPVVVQNTVQPAGVTVIPSQQRDVLAIPQREGKVLMQVQAG